MKKSAFGTRTNIEEWKKISCLPRYQAWKYDERRKGNVIFPHVEACHWRWLEKLWKREKVSVHDKNEDWRMKENNMFATFPGVEPRRKKERKCQVSTRGNMTLTITRKIMKREKSSVHDKNEDWRMKEKNMFATFPRVETRRKKERKCQVSTRGNMTPTKTRKIIKNRKSQRSWQERRLKNERK